MTDHKKIREEIGLPDEPQINQLLAALSGGDEKLSDHKRSAIRAALLNEGDRISAGDPISKTQPMKSLNPFFWLLPFGAVAIFVLFLAATTKTSPIIPTISDARQLAVAGRLGFGALPALQETAGKKSEGAQTSAPLAKTGAPIAKGPTPSAKFPTPSAESSADAGLAAPGVVAVAPLSALSATAGQGVAQPAPPPVSVRCLECGKYLPPRVVYKFSGTMPEIPAEVAVYRLSAREFSAETASALLQTLGLSGWGKISLQNVSFTEEGENPLTWTFDGGSNTLSFWRGGPYAVMAEGRADAAFPEPLPKLRGKTLTDDEALKIAADFLTKRGIAASQYGPPSVQRQENYPCGWGPCPLGASEVMKSENQAPKGDSISQPSSMPIWWNPYVTVTYSALRQGKPVLNWDASPVAGITIAINQQTREPDNGSIILPAPAISSLYPTRSSKEILDEALRGGLNPYYSDGGLYPPEEQKKRPTVTITLENAALGYVEKNSDDGQTRYLLSVVGFRGSLQDQYGNLSDWGTIVPVVK